MSDELLRAMMNAPQCLTATMDTVDDDERRRDVLFYSGAKVPRFDWWSGEEYDLSFAMDGADLSRLKADAPVLNGHSSYQAGDVLGVVENPRKTARGYEATMRFSAREDVDGIIQDIKDGILRNVSMGVAINKIVLKEEDKKAKRKHYMATEWTPFEISVVPIGADPGAKFLAADPRLSALREKHTFSDAEMQKLAADVAQHFRKLSAVSGAASDAEKNEALAKIAIMRLRHAR